MKLTITTEGESLTELFNNVEEIKKLALTEYNNEMLSLLYRDNKCIMRNQVADGKNIVTTSLIITEWK